MGKQATRQSREHSHRNFLNLLQAYLMGRKLASAVSKESSACMGCCQKRGISHTLVPSDQSCSLSVAVPVRPATGGSFATAAAPPTFPAAGAAAAAACPPAGSESLVPAAKLCAPQLRPALLWPARGRAWSFAGRCQPASACHGPPLPGCGWQPAC